jgi:hypothetical protein
VTVVVPEVADAMAASRERRAVRHVGRHRATPAPAQSRRFSGRHEGPSDILPSSVGPGARGPAPARGSQGAPGRAARARSSYARQASYVASNASLGGDRNYQGVILAEYVTALVIMLVAPLAGGSSSSSAGASPYGVADLKRIVATSACFFFIALASGGNRGKYAAMLGGLILLAILLAAAKAGAIGDFFTVVGATGTGQAPGTDTAGGRGSGG